jgi:outer membrane biosynthesis protein TonB
LKSKDFVKRKGSVYYLQLNDASRGKVTIGDVTMLFQFVVPPPMPEKPRLPATARGSLVKTIDWFYAGLLAVSAVIHIGIVVVFYNVPQPEPMDIYEMDNRWAELIVPELKQEKKKPKKPKADKKPTGKGQKIQKAEKAPKKPNKSMSSQERKAARAARRAKAREMIAGKGVLAVLGTKGAGGAGGVVADVFGEGGIGVNEGAFDGIQGVGVADGAGQRTRRGASDVGKAAGIGDLATEGGGNVSTGKKREMKVGVVKSQRPEVDGDLDPKAIARIVRARLRSIQMCYERELKRNPNLAGKISIEFTIETNGRVSDTYVVSNSMNNQAVANCIQSRIRTWVFPRPKGGSVTVAYPFIFSPAG